MTEYTYTITVKDSKNRKLPKQSIKNILDLVAAGIELHYPDIEANVTASDEALAT